MSLASAPATTRERLIDVAATCFATHGLRETTLEDVATEAGVHRATLHRAFPGGRDELVGAVVARRFLALMGPAWTWIERADGPAEAVTGIITTAVLALRDDAVLAEALQTPSGRAALQGPAGEQLPVRLAELWTALAEATLDAGLQGLDGYEPARVIDHVLRTAIGLALDPFAPQTGSELRRYIADFVTPALVHPTVSGD